MIEVYERLLPLRDDPETFEKERRKIIKEELDKLAEPQKRKAEQLLWVAEAKLRKLKNPTVRAEQAYRDMLDSLRKLNEVLNN